MRVWAAQRAVQVMTNDTPTKIILAQPVDFATTAGNTKHIGTLVRVRGFLNLVTPEPGAQLSIGIAINDIEEAQGTDAVNNVAYGQDEDILTWQTHALGAGQPSDSPNSIDNFEFDLKAMRRCDVESTLVLDMITTGNTGNSIVTTQFRSLWLVP